MTDFEEKIYEVMIENNTNIKHLMGDHKDFKDEQIVQNIRLTGLENIGRKTIKEHLISSSKVCGAFLVIVAGFTGFFKLTEKLWQ